MDAYRRIMDSATAVYEAQSHLMKTSWINGCP